jgi:hypothetical protein
MELENFKETYADMLDSALYYEKIGQKHKNQVILDSIERFKNQHSEAMSINNLDDAEAYYNELRGELFECEETIEELNLDEE